MAASCPALLLVAALIGLAGIATAVQSGEPAPLKFPDTQYEPVDWADLDGWANDDSRHGLCCLPRKLPGVK